MYVQGHQQLPYADLNVKYGKYQGQNTFPSDILLFLEYGGHFAKRLL